MDEAYLDLCRTTRLELASYAAAVEKYQATLSNGDAEPDFKSFVNVWKTVAAQMNKLIKKQTSDERLADWVAFVKENGGYVRQMPDGTHRVVSGLRRADMAEPALVPFPISVNAMTGFQKSAMPIKANVEREK